MERLIQQLGSREDVEIYDAKKRETFIRKDRRVINAAIAGALSAVYSEKILFMRWSEWRARRVRIEGAGESTDESRAANKSKGAYSENPDLKPQEGEG